MPEENDLSRYNIEFHRVLIRPCKRCGHVGLRVVKRERHSSGKLLAECEHCDHRQMEIVDR